MRKILVLLALPAMMMAEPCRSSELYESPYADKVISDKKNDTELENIRTEFRKSILAENRFDAQTIERLVSQIDSEGKWPGIDYKDVSRRGFRHSTHLKNMKSLASAYNTPNQKYHSSTKVKAAFSLALNFWLKHDFKAENWWHNEFGTPKTMKDLLLMMDSSLTSTQVKKMLQIAGRANSNAPGARASGDRISIVGIEAQVALFRRDETLFKQCIEGISREIRFGASDGSKKCMQRDYSFHHRTDRVNNTLSYGLQYANDLALWVDKVSNTSFEFPQKSVQLLVDYYLDGICKQMVYGKYEDTGSMNRDISREKLFAPMSALTPERLLRATRYRKAELQEIVDLRKGYKNEWKEFSKFFWCSEYLVVQRSGYFTSVRMFSTRNSNMEQPYNGEGLKNHYRGDGTNYLTLRGDEYTALPPVYDWMRIPGATTVITPQMPSEKEIQKKGTMDFVGALTDGYHASAAFDFASSHHPLHAKKSWFFFDREYVCLGSGVNSSAEGDVVTTVNQTSLRGEVVTNHGTIAQGSHHYSNLEWIHHDNVAYIFPEAQNICFTNQPEKGTWRNISSQTSTSKDIKSEKVLKLWIDHGQKPHDASYSYIVVPQQNIAEVDRYTQNLPVRILSNSNSLHAVEKPSAGISIAHFFEPGEVTFYGNNLLAMKTAGLVMLDYDANGKVQSVTCSDPTRKLENMAFTLNGKEYTLQLKTGDYAGSSVTLTM